MLNSKITWILILFIISIGLVQAQDEDILGDDDDMAVDKEVVCKPESLETPYDKSKNIEGAGSNLPQWYSYGSEHYKNKNYKDAYGYLWKVFLNGSGKRANLAIGKIADSYFKEKKIDSVLIACYAGFEKFPDNQKLHYYAGYVQKQLGKTPCAIPHYEALVQKNPKNKSYTAELAFLLFKNEDKRCLDLQRKVIELDPGNAKNKEVLAQMMEAFGESAIAVWKENCEKDANNIDACRNYAKLALEEGLYKESIAAYAKVMVKEVNAKDLQNRASAYENLGQFNNAIKDLKKILEQEPNNADVMLYISVNYSSLYKFSTANNWIQKAINKKPGWGKPYIYRGEMYENMVLRCQELRNKSGKTPLEDKMVYEKAQAVYRQAQKDPLFAAKAKIKVKNLKPYIRTAEDKFMEQNPKITSQCYSFLKN